jgi:hypothetical protein
MGLGGMIYIPSILKTGVGVIAILRFCFSSLRGCNVGITDVIYDVCRFDGLKCHDKHAKFHNDWFSHSNVVR